MLCWRVFTIFFTIFIKNEKPLNQTWLFTSHKYPKNRLWSQKQLSLLSVGYVLVCLLLKIVSMRSKKFIIHFLAWLVFMLYMYASSLIYYEERFTIDFIILKQCTAVLVLLILFYLNYALLTPYFLIRSKKWALFFLGAILLIGLDVVLGKVHGYLMDMYLAEDIFYKRHVFDLNYNFMTPILFLFVSTGVRFGEAFYADRFKKTELEKQVSASELAMLKSQINPHFLFNTLNNIYALATKKSDDTPEAVLKLSEIMRYMLHDTSHDKVLLSSEVKFLKNYISLQQLRLPNEVQIQFEFDIPKQDYYIAPLLLIPFVENAFKHSDLTHEKYPIRIRVFVENDVLEFFIENAIGFFEKDESSGIGIPNVRRRLDLLYKDTYDLKTSSDEQYYYVQLKIKLSKND